MTPPKASVILILLCMATLASAQAIVLTVDATLDQIVTGVHWFGVDELASLGPDALDVPEPPHAPDHYLSLAFALPDAGGIFPNRWHNDYRPPVFVGDGIEIWELHLESDQIGSTAAVTLRLVTGPPSELEVFIIGPAGRQRLEFPATFDVPMETGHEVRWIELDYASSVDSENTTWGVLKLLYR